MMARRNVHHGSVLLAAILASLVGCFGTLSPVSAVAKTRPPVEMGDPDGTDQAGPKTGARAGATAKYEANGTPASTSALEREHYANLLRWLLSLRWR